jgi:hypothetical protein
MSRKQANSATLEDFFLLPKSAGKYMVDYTVLDNVASLLAQQGWAVHDRRLPLHYINIYWCEKEDTSLNIRIDAEYGAKGARLYALAVQSVKCTISYTAQNVERAAAGAASITKARSIIEEVYGR